MNKDLIKLSIIMPVGFLSGVGVYFCEGIDPLLPYLIGVVHIGITVFVIEKVDRWNASK